MNPYVKKEKRLKAEGHSNKYLDDFNQLIHSTVTREDRLT